MAGNKGRNWKLERTHVTGRGNSRSNKYSGGDSDQKPAAGTRQRVWVGGYKRADGTQVKGHYRTTGGNA
jgi:hypothetical protein